MAFDLFLKALRGKAMSIVEVAAAVLVCQDEVWIQRRKPGRHLGESWEFPGGKLEEGESAVECLLREVREETGLILQATSVRLLEVSQHEYPDRQVRIHFFLCPVEEGGPYRGRGLWTPISRLPLWNLPPANQSVVNLLVSGMDCPDRSSGQRPTRRAQ